MKKVEYSKIKIIFLFYKKYFKYNLLFALLSILMMAAIYGTPLVNAIIIDKAIIGKDLNLLIISVIAYFLLAFISGFLNYVVSVVNLKYRYIVEKDIKNDLIIYYLNCNKMNLKDVTSAEIITIIKEDSNKFINLISRNIQDVVISIIKIIFAIILLFKLQLLLGVLVIITQFIIVLFKKRFNLKLAQNSVEIRNGRISVIEKLNNIVFHIKEISLIKADKYLVERYNIAFDNSYIKDKKSNKIFQYMNLISDLLDILTVCLILLLGGYFVIQGKMSIGIIVSFISYSSMLTSPIYELCNLPTEYSNDKESIDNIFNILIDLEKINNTTKENISNININKIIINNITFKYDIENEIFKDASVIFEKNSINYIIGKSGIGKSTLVKLILGEFSVQEGFIAFDEYNINEIIKNGGVQRYISWVPQEPILFRDTIRNNISLGGNISDERLRYVCSQCAILDDIIKLNNGFETMIDEFGNNFSVGQKHRLGLARALMQEYPIIIIDEGTAGLDFETEQVIKDNIQSFCYNKIVIIITHSSEFIIENSCVYEIKNKKIVKRRQYVKDSN